jgi:RHS repeat-associated protein
VSSALVSEYKYNALGYRIRWTYDTDADGDVDASDQTYNLTYNERWQQVAVFRGTDSSPKERYVHHAAGLDGRGGSSYIDGVILRERDHTNTWTGAADGTLEQRHYYAQNWRADVSAILSESGKMLEFVKYSGYGTPRALPAGDTNSDGDWDSNDASSMGTTDFNDNYDVRADADLNGTVDGSADAAHANSIAIGGGYQTLGWTKLSSTALFSRVGYAGYAADGVLSENRIYHVRHRVFSTDLGRWTRRDPLGYHDGMGLYEYVGSMVATATDPMGLWKTVDQCNSYFFNKITKGKGNSMACGLQLKSDLAACCTSYMGPPVGSLEKLVKCTDEAEDDWNDCGDGSQTIPPPTPVKPNPLKNPPALLPNMPQQPPPDCFKNCFGKSFKACEICCIQSCSSKTQEQCQGWCSTLVINPQPFGPKPKITPTNSVNND